MPYQDFEMEDLCQAPGCNNTLSKPDPGEGDDRRRFKPKTVACSAACHKRVQRDRAGFRKEPRPCRFCGELVWDYRGNDVRCPEDDRTDRCDELQYDAENQAAIVDFRRENRTAVCAAPGCDREVTWSGKGRVKTICSPRCRQRVSRARKQEAQ